MQIRFGRGPALCTLALVACASGGRAASDTRKTDGLDAGVASSLNRGDASVPTPADSGSAARRDALEPCLDCSTEVCDREECDDGLWCTADGCTVDGCTQDLGSGSCLIVGTCYESGVANPFDPCLACVPSSSARSWTITEGTACDDHDSCTTVDRCGADGACVGSPRVEGREPNQEIEQATYLGTIEDNDGYPSSTLTANLYPTGDVDWYSYGVVDTLTGRLSPRVEFTPGSLGAQTLCAYWVCESSTLDVDCIEGISNSHSGFLGCCAEPWWGAVELDPDCGGLDDSGFVLVEVTRVGRSATCEPYELRWGDN